MQIISVYLGEPENNSSSLSDESQSEKPSIDPGLAFWIVYDWPDFAVKNFERQIIQRFLESGLSIKSCKSVKGRGKIIS